MVERVALVQAPSGATNTHCCDRCCCGPSAPTVRIAALQPGNWPEISTRHYVLAVFRALETGSAIVKSEYGRAALVVRGLARLRGRGTPKRSDAPLSPRLHDS